MSDPGIRAAERGVRAVANRIRAIYGLARKEIEATIQKYNMRFMKNDEKMRQKLAAGEITELEYRSWLRTTVYIGKEWDGKVKHCTKVMQDANERALKIVQNEQIGVFAENMTYQAYLLEKGARMNLGFSIYSNHAVNRLLQKQPELLPRRVIDGVKDRAWNREKIANVITKSIIKGDGISGVAKSLAETLSTQNDNAMERYARTAMTAAQNGGRIEMMREADDEGVHTKKKWIATLDDRTRDAHADLDGETADIDEPFENDIGEIMYPGDPSADPGNVYNCRCTLGYVIEGVEAHGERRAYKEWDDDEGNHHRESYLVEDMSYNEWKAWKEGR